MIAGGVNDAETAFTSVAARRFASPSCRQLKALSSRFSDAGCPAPKGIRLSGERVITRVDSFQSTSPSSPLGRTPRTPFSAGGIQPSLRSGQVSLDEAEHFPAQSR